VFGAIKKDPLYLWRPSWATGVVDKEFPAGGITTETVPRFNHDLRASDLPDAAAADAASVARQSGWQPGNDTFTYTRAIQGTSLLLIVYIAPSTGLKVLTMSFTAGNS